MSEASASKARNTAGLRPWQPGQSGNKKGRPPAQMDLSLLCREHAPEAIARLLDLLRSDDNRAVAWAIGTILDRAFGKAKLVIEGDGAMALGALHLIAARFVSEQMQLRTAGKQANGASPGPDAAPVIDLTDPAVWAAPPPALE